ncbi:hypothetical protein NEUTE1DRAFT_112581 [Neurospora tetrasperma FGSC 2508]|uniref:Uncharacterized protein n=1 Tax=Neurospora tetrasperma (strain FGSC 2508 / ATCC MYA-4615 / P0657) TaxID=510951 RepID=F8MW24_NEUT8|nr:uncharacterized protein NEUTE1DRAFT_112581 [Neurospora tetrasperma FGSC 2508]EGO54019.1 hypothetical protein NEUTE1DRAFT_112581 [Neurospora tetrasperma FGSC 2508]EGZ68560.1 hypothetical protein NEUTE2DRAFT_133207 [Neurospora tetrasperma FGSC 2509]
MDPTARFPASADSQQARVDLLPENINPETSPARSSRSTNTQPEDIPGSQDAKEEAQYDNNEAVTPTSQAASSTVDSTDLSLALNSNSASPHTEVDGDEDIEEDIAVGQTNLNLQIPDVPPPPPASEETLRQQAVAWMEAANSDVPNGQVVQPPPWYAYSRTEHPDRPRIWIKDFFTGHVRPRRLVNDRLAEMSLVERERWENRQRRIRGEPAD